MTHVSIILVLRLSDTILKRFQDNDVLNHEKKLENLIITGQPKLYHVCPNMSIVVYGVFSAKGFFCSHLEMYPRGRDIASVVFLGITGKYMFAYFGLLPKGVNNILGISSKKLLDDTLLIFYK